MLITAAIIVPVAPTKLRFGLLAFAVVLAGIAGAAATKQRQTEENNDYAKSFKDWNGALVLVDGASTTLPDSAWKPLHVDAPYNNDTYEHVTLQWRKTTGNDDEQYVDVTMSNTTVAEACNRDECLPVGNSNLGPLFENSSHDLMVDVPNGSISLDAQDYDGDSMALINSLDSVDAEQFVRVAQQINS